MGDTLGNSYPSVLSTGRLTDDDLEIERLLAENPPEPHKPGLDPTPPKEVDMTGKLQGDESRVLEPESALLSDEDLVAHWEAREAAYKAAKERLANKDTVSKEDKAVQAAYNPPTVEPGGTQKDLREEKKARR